MKYFLTVASFALTLQACGSGSIASLNNASEPEPEIGELVAINSVLSLSGSTSESSLQLTVKAEPPAGSSAGGAAPAPAPVKEPAKALVELAKSVRVTFEPQNAASAAGKKLAEKVVLEQDFPADVNSTEVIENKSTIKLRHAVKYNVLVEQLRDGKVLQETKVEFLFKRKDSSGIKISTSQRSGVTLRNGKGENNVLRECPAGQFMSGIGFNEIPICRNIPVASAIAGAAEDKPAAPVCTDPATGQECKQPEPATPPMAACEPASGQPCKQPEAAESCPDKKAADAKTQREKTIARR